MRGGKQKKKQDDKSRNESDKKPIYEFPGENDQTTLVRPYGDKLNDGVVQMSFTLPTSASEEARMAAARMIENKGFKKVQVIQMESMGPGYTFFVVYTSLEDGIDLSEIELPKLDYPQYSFNEINKMLQSKFNRKLVVLGACIGTDAHTVGIDAIFNMKGYMGDYGLERYSSLKAINLRAQVSSQDLVDKIIQMEADAVLVSRVVTQRDEHITELKSFLDILEQNDAVPKHLVKICGGPRISHHSAVELGFDAGFGPGTKPSQVASYLATELINRIG